MAVSEGSDKRTEYSVRVALDRRLCREGGGAKLGKRSINAEGRTTTEG
jgi:hypothetical protein